MLEQRRVLSTVPLGASPDDTAEYMLGDVLVTVVLLESDGSGDTSTENWTTAGIERVKQNVQEGLTWWEELLDQQGSVHSLDFQLDFTYADQPVATSYEPIARPSDDFHLWLDDFFAVADVPAGGTFSERIRQFNHAQRQQHETNWAFTIFVVNAASDADHRFDAGGSFSQSFAYAGGRFFVTTSERPASAIAHETGHMFWAMDEYSGGKSYSDVRGYYRVQNTNALDGNPQPASRVRSIMDSHVVAYPTYEISPSAKESIGWRDTDGDGIFDVLDVEHQLVGVGQFDWGSRLYTFQGHAEVQTLPNQNPSGTGHAITLNQLDELQVRFEGRDWTTLRQLEGYEADLRVTFSTPDDASWLELRTIDLATGVVSNLWTDSLPAALSAWQNASLPLDVNADQIVAPLDALLVINRLNQAGSGELPEPTGRPPFWDTNGDGLLSPVDALLVINYLNNPPRPRFAQAMEAASSWPVAGELVVEGESTAVDVVFAALDETWDRLRTG